MILVLLISSVFFSAINMSAIIAAKPFETYSLFVSLAIAISLGLWFHYLQRQDNENMRQVILKIDERDTKRKVFWVNAAIKKMQAIIDAYHSVSANCENVLKDGSKLDIDSIWRTINEFHFVKEWHVPALRQALAQIADLLIIRCIAFACSWSKHSKRRPVCISDS